MTKLAGFRQAMNSPFHDIMGALTRNEFRKATRAGWDGGFVVKDGLYIRRYTKDLKIWTDWYPTTQDMHADDWSVLP